MLFLFILCKNKQKKIMLETFSSKKGNRVLENKDWKIERLEAGRGMLEVVLSYNSRSSPQKTNCLKNTKLYY
ncbi:hypothetical protein BBH99_07365 [Chryseobacterium contaminans]|uniref:Uncharacterized protein n=2 Tax=Chryseobacterium contaminans TaxID=1423959 RepID=A0ABX2X7J4_9FLAO|nr:hypothetical protein BBH99_07365 [Chryseobacterium contaminans]